jgi:LmbE family N-acetylglucosaminyl deacetylase
VTVVVVTDGDAYCEACRFWKNGSVNGAMCTAAELSNFAAVRRSESEAAMKILGAPAPRFLDYPDTGLAAAWRNDPIRRSDFSSCASCASCGYGNGPATTLSAETLQASLRELIAAEPEHALIATTHWLDGHPDHAALGNFVRRLHGRHPVAYAVIHAHTKNTNNADCWYPAPGAPQCPCMDDEAKALRDPEWVARNAGVRFRPATSSALPNDAGYGQTTQLHLSEDDAALKLRAVRAYASQSGRLGSHPAALDGIIDCSGYLSSFVRRTETFILQP